MSFDPQTIFANLAEKERIKGHHSPEGRAIRTLSRGLHGFSSGSLLGRDVVVLCDQAVEDWLKAKCKISPWSARSLPHLLVRAVQARWITPLDAVRLQKLRQSRQAIDQAGATVAKPDVECTLNFCIELVEKHWL